MKYLPLHVELGQAAIVLSVKESHQVFYLSNLRIRHGVFSVKVNTNNDAPFIIKGRIDPGERSFEITEIYGLTTTKVLDLSLLNQQFSFSAQDFSFKIVKKKAGSLLFLVMMKQAEIISPLVSADKLVLEYFQLNFSASLNTCSFCIGKSSFIQYNALRMETEAEHFFTEKNIRFDFAINDFSPAHFLQSFPAFTCKELREMQYAGNLSLTIAGNYFLKEPDKSICKVSVDTHSFSILQPETSAFHKLKSPFVHTVYRNGSPVRQIHLLKDAPGFIDFKSIPGILYYTIIATEDPGFFAHKGVDSFFIGYAFLANVKAGKIVRGGSTITMQLAKNLYLYNNKNLYRKMEEAVVAWLLEEIFKVPKERLLEIYLNIIEFNAHTYGIKEASEYYFFRLPQQLTLTECIVLSYIIPRPKYFDAALDMNSPQLRENLKRHMESVSQALYYGGLITIEELDDIRFSIPIRNGMLQLDRL